MKPVLTIFVLISMAALFSCKVQQKVPKYLEGVSDTSGVETMQIPQLKIQKNDQLSIQVYSASTRPDISDAIFNQQGMGSTAPTATSQGPGAAAGYLVDADGFIQMPRIGRLQVEGMTKQELADQIKRKINEKDSILTDPTVIIRFHNLKITVLGEVNAQGVLTIPGEKLTILEAIGLAGGINDFGMKNAVKVIRETDGKREIGLVDLSSANLFQSPYYNLTPNDVVLVDASTRKNMIADQNLVIQRVSFGLSIITAFALIYNILQ